MNREWSFRALAGVAGTAARRMLTALAALGPLATFVACADGPLPAVSPQALLGVHVLTPATIRLLTVEISGPGINPAQLANLPVNSDGVASGIIETTAGAARRIVVTAVDTASIPTHRGDTTIALMPGTNPPLSMVLRPLGATVGITLTFGR